MFIDEKTLTVQAGKGGDGATLFRREIYVPKGGPDGGDGGRGGDVILEAQGNLHALNHLAHTDLVRAEDGKVGGHSRSTGKSGSEARLLVPLGTVIEEKDEEQWLPVVELTENGQTHRIAKGGNGGWGNWHFRSSVQQAPERHNDGQPGERKLIRLTLKLIADVGLVGFPNAGKSTLLSVISAAKPKIANYPFTTLEPQLGVAEVRRGQDLESVVVADLPGLIEGASEGKGLGTKFLRHLERTRTIIHCIDATTPQDELTARYQEIRQELHNWSETLASKPERIALTKSELLQKDELEAAVQTLHKATDSPVFLVSAATHQGLTKLLTGI